MGEYVKQVSKQAMEELRDTFGRQLLPAENPILELIGFLLGDGFGEVQSPPTMPISSQQWLDWHHLAFTTPGELIAVLNFILETERPKFPTELTAMRIWAASLLLNTLDQLQMT